MKWTRASERLPDRLTGYIPAKSKSLGPITAFYTEAGCTEIVFDDEVDYEDEDGYLLEGWYRVYDSIRDGMHFTVPCNDIIEWLDESDESPESSVWPGEDNKFTIAEMLWWAESKELQTHRHEGHGKWSVMPMIKGAQLATTYELLQEHLKNREAYKIHPVIPESYYPKSHTAPKAEKMPQDLADELGIALMDSEKYEVAQKFANWITNFKSYTDDTK